MATAVFTARNLSGEVYVAAIVESVSSTPRLITILDESAPSQINLTANPDSIIVQGTSTVTAEVLDAVGDPVPNGTTVIFEVENELYGTISPSSVTNSGFATATFEAANQPGVAAINVSCGGISESIDIDIEQAPPAAIEFVSADPQRIAISGSGGTEISVVTFLVKDSNGDPLSGINVLFRMAGPGGGAYINPSDQGDEIEVSTDGNGIALCRLYSGLVAGPVTISATIDVSGTPMTVRSSVISIGGGVPSAKRFYSGSELLNLPGLERINRTTEVTALLADRFGNYNVLNGTTVSFVTEAGLTIESSEVTANELGAATVTVRTQGPAFSYPEDVLPEPWEVDLQSYLLATYGYITDAHPRDGLCSVLVYTMGEEHFDDTNANGVYDSGVDTFLVPDYDTLPDPFCDYNDKDLYDGPNPAPPDPEEFFVSADGTGIYNGTPNGVWDDNKYIFCNFPILITGSPIILYSPSCFTVENGGSEIIWITVCDRNLNQLIPGSTVKISNDGGKLSGVLNYEFLNSNVVGPNMYAHLGLIQHPVIIRDDDPDDTDDPENATITIEVTWEGATYTRLIFGTVD